MTKQDKINSLLAWALCGCQISERNRTLLYAQFSAMAEDEIDRRLAMQARRRA
jgi:hypothetical protein